MINWGKLIIFCQLCNSIVKQALAVPGGDHKWFIARELTSQVSPAGRYLKPRY